VSKAPADVCEIAARLSPTQRALVLRCSDATDWCAQDGRTFGRQWGDLCAFRGGSMRTIRALVRKGLVVEDRRHLFGLTALGSDVRARLVHEGFRP
jgi:hypothetical protein